jgi:hypothetical protein
VRLLLDALEGFLLVCILGEALVLFGSLVHAL